MNLLTRIVAVLLVIIGVVWMLQGFNLLPGSFMTGQLEWAAYGALSVAVGVALLFWKARRGN
jgi:uncharacterized membrane protein HdeD (DUF308 family)